MTVFACAGCGAPLTVPLSRVALPAHARQYGSHVLLGPLLEPATYAVETPGGSIAVAPGDLRGTGVIPGRTGGDCFGITGPDGPNLACERCGAPVATRIDDCGWWQVTWLEPAAVRRVPGPEAPVLTWAELRTARLPVPPVEDDCWSPLWTAAVAAALPGVLVRSGGSRVAVPRGLLAGTFGRALDALLPPGPRTRTLGLDRTADITLVPRHPQTGAHDDAAGAVPLEYDVWAYLALHRELPAAAERHREEPAPRLAWGAFEADGYVFRDALRRIPDAGEPWLREIRERVEDRPLHYPF
ncbi:hypothetical protein Val02_78860 [Virgisporangium aliadipatigenens]|uniref:Uncharacterized protein n=1 Tax=Virgisporangium aliadipatigenens TaxID=741659 RepID=A0A8J3YW81_9ACTN|nr:hypothetical protein [Virgisporangium aliadipatigenens]GIJ51000.1 hypothetical protein Val02_78860 [Virgisporangium aliadipatigenens]